MKKTPSILLVLLAAALSACAPQRKPAGGPSLIELNPSEFQERFNAAAGEVRLLALLAPT